MGALRVFIPSRWTLQDTERQEAWPEWSTRHCSLLPATPRQRHDPSCSRLAEGGNDQPSEWPWPVCGGSGAPTEGDRLLAILSKLPTQVPHLVPCESWRQGRLQPRFQEGAAVTSGHGRRPAVSIPVPGCVPGSGAVSRRPLQSLFLTSLLVGGQTRRKSHVCESGAQTGWAEGRGRNGGSLARLPEGAVWEEC